MPTVSWGESVLDFLTWKRTNGRKETTADFYRVMLSQFLHWCDREEIQPEDFDRRHMRRYMDWRRGRLSEHTYYSDFRALKTFFKYAKAERYVKVNPFAGENGISLKRPEAKPPTCPTTQEAERIFRAVTHFRSEDCQSGRYMYDDLRSYLIARDHCIMKALIETGARLGEILSLRPENVYTDEVDDRGRTKPEDLRRPYLALTKTKTGRVRDVPVSVEWTRLYSRWMRTRPTFAMDGSAILAPNVFITRKCRPISVPWFSRLFGKYALAAGCPQWTPHSLRRMRGTAVGEINPAIGAELLGNSPEVFYRSYMVKRPEKIREVWEQTIRQGEVNQQEQRAV